MSTAGTRTEQVRARIAMRALAAFAIAASLAAARPQVSTAPEGAAQEGAVVVRPGESRPAPKGAVVVRPGESRPAPKGPAVVRPGEAGPAPEIAAAAVPVLLVPGWLDTARDLSALRIRLLSSGWADREVAALTFEEPTGSNRDHAIELDSAITALLTETGADQIDIVAHSMGGLATRWYLKDHADARVRRVVFIASPHRGTISAHLAWGGGRPEMMPDSDFLDSLNTTAPVPEGVEVITIRTAVDTHIVPGESATLPGVPDHRLCCPTHAGLLRDGEVFEIVRDFLEHGIEP